MFLLSWLDRLGIIGPESDSYFWLDACALILSRDQVRWHWGLFARNKQITLNKKSAATFLGTVEECGASRQKVKGYLATCRWGINRDLCSATRMSRKHLWGIVSSLLWRTLFAKADSLCLLNLLVVLIFPFVRFRLLKGIGAGRNMVYYNSASALSHESNHTQYNTMPTRNNSVIKHNLLDIIPET